MWNITQKDTLYEVTTGISVLFLIADVRAPYIIVIEDLSGTHAYSVYSRVYK